MRRVPRDLRGLLVFHAVGLTTAGVLLALTAPSSEWTPSSLVVSLFLLALLTDVSTPGQKGMPVRMAAGELAIIGRRFTWLGGKQRRADLNSGVISMGVRTYVPHLGRFTAIDPVRGGSANIYDYARQDPLNNVDLDGRASVPGFYSCDISAPRIVQRRGRRLRAYFNFRCRGDIGALKFDADIVRHRAWNTDKVEQRVRGNATRGGRFYIELDGPCKRGKRYHGDLRVFLWLQRGTREQRGPKIFNRRGPSYTCR